MSGSPRWRSPPRSLAGQVFRVSAATLGYVYDLPVGRRLALGLGVQGSLNFVPTSIRFAYSEDPAGVMPFVRLKLR